jgi:ferredoxin
MPTVEFNGQSIECDEGERLRDVLLRSGETPHNGNARWLNCKGFGTCGTCAVEIVDGDVPDKNARESWRLDFPPHDSESGLRLACQVLVTSDMKVRKYPGFWGQDVDEEPVR